MKPTSAAMRVARSIWHDVDTFDLPTEQGVPKLADIIERETLCGEMLETLRGLLTLVVPMQGTTRRAETHNAILAEAERLITKVEGQ